MSGHFGAWASGLLLLTSWVGLKMLALFYFGESKKGVNIMNLGKIVVFGIAAIIMVNWYKKCRNDPDEYFNWKMMAQYLIGGLILYGLFILIFSDN